MERLSSFLERHHVADIPGHGKILEIPDDMDPLEAFEVCFSCLCANGLVADCREWVPFSSSHHCQCIS